MSERLKVVLRTRAFFGNIKDVWTGVLLYRNGHKKKTKNKQIFIRLKRVTTSPSSLYIFCIWLILYCISYATVFVNSVDRFSAALLDNSLSRINDVRTFGVLK